MGHYKFTVYGNGIAINVTEPNGTSVFLQGDDAAMLCDEIDDAAQDIAENRGRWGRLGQYNAAFEIFGQLFD